MTFYNKVLAGRYAVLLPLFFKFLLLLLLLFQKKSRNLDSRYGTSRRPALLVVASFDYFLPFAIILTTKIMGPLNATPSYGQFDQSVSTDIFNIPDIPNIPDVPDVLNVPDIPIIIYISSSLWFHKGMILDNRSEFCDIPVIPNIPDIPTIDEIPTFIQMSSML